MGDEFFQHEIDPRIADPGIEFAVAEGSGTPFAIAHIAFGIEDPLILKGRNIFGPLFDRFAPFQNNRAGTSPSQNQGGEHSGRPKSSDDRAIF
ncbi:MAG: hypothetical protein BWY98_00550 [Tenericutes bacterium ADurb.BinA155]|nr:MAG: hypothetical protein BWY98_00550 [Tenericutes bacterium ADurb.BinA155]